MSISTKHQINLALNRSQDVRDHSTNVKRYFKQVQENGLLLQYIEEKFHTSQIYTAAINQNPESLQYAIDHNLLKNAAIKDPNILKALKESDVYTDIIVEEVETALKEINTQSKKLEKEFTKLNPNI
jgi:glutamine synthetase adenylyltransferase